MVVVLRTVGAPGLPGCGVTTDPAVNHDWYKTKSLPGTCAVRMKCRDMYWHAWRPAIVRSLHSVLRQMGKNVQMAASNVATITW
jgi:hypothetical protein